MTNVLFVEDEGDLRNLIFEALSDLGYSVTLARNGDEAIKQLHGDVVFSHVITDVSMPKGITGIDVASQAAELQPRAKVLIVSGYQKSQLPPLPEGTQFLSKPYRLGQLITAIKEQTPGV